MATSSSRSELNTEEAARVESDFLGMGVADLGFFLPGAEKDLVYILHAPEGQDLTRIEIKSDCPCIRALNLPAVIPAGSSHPIRMRFVAPHKVLHYQQPLTVVAESSSKRVEYPLRIDARLGLPLKATPEHTFLSEANNWSTLVRVTNDGLEPVQLIYALSSDPSVRATVPRVAITPGTHVEITLRADEGWRPTKPVLIRIKTMDEDQPEVVVEVREYQAEELVPELG